jgi:hypothetical protein
MFSRIRALSTPVHFLCRSEGQLDALGLGQLADLVSGELGAEQREQGAEGLRDAAMGCGRQQNQVARRGDRQVFEQLVTLLLVGVGGRGGSSAMGFVHDDEVGTVLEEIGTLPVAFGEINADHLDGVMAEDAATAGRDAALKLVDRSRTDEHGIEIEFLIEFLLPLFAEVGRAKDAEAFDFAPVVEFAADEQALDRLANANVIGDEHPDGVEAQGHEERDELIRSRADGDPPQRAERRGPLPQRETGCLPQQVGTSDIRDVIR